MLRMEIAYAAGCDVTASVAKGLIIEESLPTWNACATDSATGEIVAGGVEELRIFVSCGNVLGDLRVEGGLPMPCSRSTTSTTTTENENAKYTKYKPIDRQPAYAL